ncbi:MAG: hypothetical protein ACPW60_07200 [Methylohalobius sp. ZOD2]
MRVEWSDPARDDLDGLVRYISRDSAFYARRFGEKVVLGHAVAKKVSGKRADDPGGRG